MTEPAAHTPCRGCAGGGECLFSDAVAVAVLDVLDHHHGSETNSTGLTGAVRAALAGWHGCGPGRDELERVLAAAGQGTNALGFSILLRRALGLAPRC